MTTTSTEEMEDMLFEMEKTTERAQKKLRRIALLDEVDDRLMCYISDSLVKAQKLLGNAEKVADVAIDCAIVKKLPAKNLRVENNTVQWIEK